MGKGNYKSNILQPFIKHHNLIDFGQKCVVSACYNALLLPGQNLLNCRAVFVFWQPSWNVVFPIKNQIYSIKWNGGMWDLAMITVTVILP